MAYAMLSTYGKGNRSVSAAAAMLRGYQVVNPLTAMERKHLVLLVACRLACSATLGAYSFQQNPENTYLLLHAEPAWKALEMIWCYGTEQRENFRVAFDSVLDQACLYGDARGVVIDCADLLCADPIVSDILASVRVQSFRISQPSPKKRRLSTQGLPIITFVTGNVKKLEEVQHILRLDYDGYDDTRLPFTLNHHKVDLAELQGDPVDVAKQKCKLAAEKLDCAVITEDTSLCFQAMGNLPGPYIKWYLEGCGLEGLNKMLDGFTDRSAYAQTIVCFSAGPGHDPAIFDGRTAGTIVRPRGPLNFGWDPIFEPDQGHGRTYAEMTLEEKNAISHRSRAFIQLRSFLKAQQATLKGQIS
jgi:inosine triphosphate pyrophosphatase